MTHSAQSCSSRAVMNHSVQQSCSSRAVVVRSRSSRAVVLNRAAVAQYRIVQSVAMSAQAMSARGRPHPHLVKLSKFLVYVCRHGATSWGLQADPDGWLAIDDVHSLKPLRSAPGRAGIIQIVEDACEGDFSSTTREHVSEPCKATLWPSGTTRSVVLTSERLAFHAG